MKINLFVITFLFFYPAASMEMPDRGDKKTLQMSESQMIKQLDSTLKEIHSGSAFYQIQCVKALEYGIEYDYHMFADHALIKLKKNWFPWNIPKKIIQKSFFIAVQKGNVAMVQRFLQERKDLFKECSPELYTWPLNIAAEMGNLEVAQILVHTGDNPNRILLEAVCANDVTKIRTLLLVGADPDLLIGKNKVDSINSLMESSYCRNYEAAETLLNGIEYPSNLMQTLKKLKKPTYFSLLPTDLVAMNPYLAQHFKIQADPNIKSRKLKKTALEILTVLGPKSVEETQRHEHVKRLLESKMGKVIEKPKITPMELYKLTHEK